MAFQFKGGNQNGSSSGTTANIDLSGLNILPGDLVVFYVNSDVASAPTIDNDNGASWTTAFSGTISTETAAHALAWKVAAGEPTSYSFTVGNGRWCCAILIYSCDGTPIIDASATTDEQAGTGSDFFMTCEAQSGVVISPHALSIITAGKDNRPSATNKNYTTSPEGWSDGVAGRANVGEQSAAIAGKVIDSKGLTGPSTVTIRTSDDSDANGDYSYSGHISFIETESFKPSFQPAIIRKPWTKQPPAGTPVDLSNPLTRDLALLVNGNQYNTATLTDSANKNHWVLKESTAGSTSPQFVSEGSNIALSNRPDPSYYWEHPTADPGGLFTVSIICIFRVNNHMSNGGMPFGCGETAITADHRICIKVYSDEIRIQTYQDGSNTAYNYETFGGPGVLTNQWYAVGGMFDTTGGRQDLYYYIDDRFDIEGPQLPALNQPIFSTDPQKYKIANGDVGDANREFDGDVLFAAAWHDRRLSHTEFFSVMNNPWQLFKPQTIYLGKPEARRVVTF